MSDRKLIRGTTREDGKVFFCYSAGYEQWVTPEVFAERCEQQVALCRAREAANPGRAAAKTKEWRIKNKDRHREHQAAKAVQVSILRKMARNKTTIKGVIEALNGCKGSGGRQRVVFYVTKRRAKMAAEYLEALLKQAEIS